MSRDRSSCYTNCFERRNWGQSSPWKHPWTSQDHLSCWMNCLVVMSELLDELPCRDELKPKFPMEEPMDEPPIIWVDGPEPKFDIEGVIRRCCKSASCCCLCLSSKRTFFISGALCRIPWEVFSLAPLSPISNHRPSFSSFLRNRPFISRIARTMKRCLLYTSDAADE